SRECARPRTTRTPARTSDARTAPPTPVCESKQPAANLTRGKTTRNDRRLHHAFAFRYWTAPLSKQARENLWDFEDGLVVQRGYILAKYFKLAGAQHPLYAANHFLEAVQHDANLLLLHPLRVVAFLRQRPRIAFNQHWQLADHRFRDASRP